ncbi:hypothetical protein RZE82_04755 [Mollicutes bacterium LVI A0039]|nr:hypothetical protein RZE82_04755 [Mollicutes bacterium LVI A0039]
MKTLNIKKEVAVEHRTIKVMINDNKRAITSREEQQIDLLDEDENIYLKALFCKTNTVKIPLLVEEYNLTWKQNYVYVIGFIIVLAVLVTKFVVGSYEISERIVVLAGGAIAVGVFWNELLILGRKIKVEKHRQN